jgi:hypothetical protein
MTPSISLSTPRQNAFGETYFEEVNHLSFDKQPSELVFQKHYHDLVKEEEALFVVIGTDSGLLFRFMQSQTLAKNVKFVFIEYPEVIEAAGLTDALQDTKAQVRLVKNGFHLTQLRGEFSGYIMRRKIHLIRSLAVMDAKKNTPYQQLWAHYEIEYAAFVRMEFNAQSTKVFEEERLLNAADNIVPLAQIKACLIGRDVLILGGGPTLDDAIEWIKAQQSKLVIFAAARIANRMAREGIIPDFFVTVDPFDWSFDNAKGVLAFAESSILVTSYHAQHKLVSQWNGARVFGGDKYGFKALHTGPNIGVSGPTVTNTAVHVAASLGAKRLFFSGIDFCFAKGKTHESGSQEAKMSDTFGYKDAARIEDYAGNLTETTDDFYAAFHAMQASVAAYKQQYGTEVYSLGWHSAKMQGVPYIDCAEVVVEGEDKTAWLLDLREKVALTHEAKQQAVAQTCDELSEQLKRFKKLQELAGKGEGLVKKLYDPKTKMMKSKGALQVKKQHKKISALIGEDGDMLMNYQASFFYDAFKPIEDEQNMTSEEVEEQWRGFFKGTKQVSEHFIQTLEKGLKRAQLRLHELAGDWLPCQLLPEWTHWHEFGRARAWQAWHGDKLLSETEQACLNEALATFDAEYEKQEHNYFSMVQKKISNVPVLYARAKSAFESGQTEELNAIIEHAQSLEAADETQRESFISMLQGLLAELSGEIDQAVALYQSITMPFFKMEALKRTISLSIAREDFQTALVSTEQLCAFSLEYLQPYADMLALLGHKEMAVEVMRLYIHNNEHTQGARLKLVQWLIQLQKPTEALAELDSLLAENPDNAAALRLKESLQ